MRVGERQPYAGELVFTAFSGSHQDAIAKGMAHREKYPDRPWSVPYLPIDPKDIGREYEGDIIRINSQSGKGGVAYILQQSKGIDLPKEMRESFGYTVKGVSDRLHKELSPDEIFQIFMENYVNLSSPLEFVRFEFAGREGFATTVTVRVNGEEKQFTNTGTGRLDAISNALRENFGVEFKDLSYTQHALESGSQSRAISFIGVTAPDGSKVWGCGIDEDIMTSSVRALFSVVNKLLGARVPESVKAL